MTSFAATNKSSTNKTQFPVIALNYMYCTFYDIAVFCTLVTSYVDMALWNVTKLYHFFFAGEQSHKK